VPYLDRVARLREIHEHLAYRHFGRKITANPEPSYDSSLIDLSRYDQAAREGMVQAMHESRRNLLSEQIPRQNLLDRLTRYISATLVRRNEVPSMPFYVGSYPTGRFNAMAVATRYGALILVDLGLLASLTQVMEVFSAAVQLETRVLGEPLVAPQAEGETLAILQDIFASYVPEGERRTIDFSIPPHKKIAATSVSASAQAFAICHELAHVALGHLFDASRLAVPLSTGIVETYRLRHDEEFAADRLALDWLVDGVTATRLHSRQGPTPDSESILTAPTLFFYLHQALAVVGAAWHSYTSMPDSHPPSYIRLERLREHMDEMELPAPYLGNVLSDWLSTVSKTLPWVGPPVSSPLWQRYALSSEEEIAGRIITLVESWGPVPPIDDDETRALRSIVGAAWL
jgi:hypothetical protein